MAGKDNYLIQANQAKARFLTYDQEKLIRKLNLQADEDWLYMTMLSSPYRLCRKTGNLERFCRGSWTDANSYAEVMTLLDLLCDSAQYRYISGRWKNMQEFGLLFHRNLLENSRDPWAQKFQDDPEGFSGACLRLKGTPLAMGDLAYAIELFDGLCIALQLWFGDEEFPPNLRILWDENAGQYIRYETMYFAKGLLLQRIAEGMQK